MRLKLPFLALLLLWLAGGLTPRPALAFPPLPSSFYGTVKVNGQNVPDGTVVRALIDGQVYAEAPTQTYQGNSVYSVDVKGDDSDTPERDGGLPDAVVQFEIGGVPADQTGLWRSGTNIEINLTASSSGSLAPPQPTLVPAPTQTPIGYSAPAPADPPSGSRDDGRAPWLIAGSAAMAVVLAALWVARRRR